MHQAVEIKLQGKALSGKKNKPVVCCRMCTCMLCVFSSKCMCVWETGEREGGGAEETAKGEEEEGVHRGPRGMGMEGKRVKGRRGGEEANWASTHTSPPPIRVTHLPFTQHITLHFWCLQSSGKEITVNITAAAMAFHKKRDILCLKCV